jgi:hypothetical protein
LLYMAQTAHGNQLIVPGFFFYYLTSSSMRASNSLNGQLSIASSRPLARIESDCVCTSPPSNVVVGGLFRGFSIEAMQGSAGFMAGNQFRDRDHQPVSNFLAWPLFHLEIKAS